MSPKNNTILVRLDNKQEYITAKFPSPVNLGETVICRADDDEGEVEIYFNVNGSPFRNQNGSLKKEIDSNDPPLKLKVIGDFSARCYITTPKGKLEYLKPKKGEKLPLGVIPGGGNVIVKGQSTAPSQ